MPAPDPGYSNIEYRVETVHSIKEEPIGGLDTTIFSIPAEVISDGVIVVTWLAQYSRTLAEKQADELHEVFHHGEFVLTSDPAVIQARGIMHDCEACRTAVRSAMRVLRDDPDRQLVVGNLYWQER